MSTQREQRTADTTAARSEARNDGLRDHITAADLPWRFTFGGRRYILMLTRRGGLVMNGDLSGGRLAT